MINSGEKHADVFSEISFVSFEMSNVFRGITGVLFLQVSQLLYNINIQRYHVI